jgi:hypothetical protein
MKTRIFNTEYYIHWNALKAWKFWASLVAVLILGPPYFLWVVIGKCLRRVGQWMIDVSI